MLQYVSSIAVFTASTITLKQKIEIPLDSQLIGIVTLQFLYVMYTIYVTSSKHVIRRRYSKPDPMRIYNQSN